MGSRTRNGTVLRIAGTLLVAATAVGLTPVAADAAPRRPSDTQISQAQARAAEVERRIGDLGGQLAAAQAQAEAAHTASALALDEYQATQEAFEAAQTHAEEAAEAAEPAEDDDDLTGVEIEITPAGKSTKRLTLLSGGEKSMTALAFLFAVFLARPCPFYILDEVEAALDDLNIERFLAVLRRYADRAQFIVVTHQKRTMEAADCLYGVSMAGNGVSKVVSRKLPRPVEAPAEAAVA